jgi:hypothetical protein
MRLGTGLKDNEKAARSELAVSDYQYVKRCSDRLMTSSPPLISLSKSLCYYIPPSDAALAHKVNLNPTWPSSGAFSVPASTLLFVRMK